MFRTVFLASAGIVIAGIAAPPASASYMQTCKKLITEWDSCRETGDDCKPQYSAIEEACKCHAEKQGEWKLINAAVAKDDVCGETPTTIIIPPPPPPPPREIYDPGGNGAGDRDGHGEKHEDGKKTGDN